MKKTYQLQVAGLTRELTLFEVSEDLYIAGFILFGDVEMTVACARELIKQAPEYDIILTPESKGIPLVHEMARQSGRNDYIIARKGPKVYMQDVLITTVNSITTTGQQMLCIDGKEAAKMKGKRVLILDDVISTGESLAAAEKLVTQAGGIIAGKMAVLAEGDAAKRTDIIALAPLPLFDRNGNPKQI